MKSIKSWFKKDGRRLGIKARITIAMGIVTFTILTLSMLALMAEIPFVEERLVSESMYYDLQAMIPHSGDDLKGSPSNPERHFHTDNEALQAYGATPIPERYAHLSEGYSEHEGPHSYFVYKIVRDGHSYILEVDQTEFEETEMELRWLTIGCAILILILVMMIMYVVVHRLLSPLRELTSAVQQSAAAGTYRPLKVRLTDDEIGYLAATCDRSFKHIYELLARERFFSADLSHELRTQLSVISTSAEVMYSTANLAQQRRLNGILKACDDTLRLLRVLLALARNDSRDSADEHMLTITEAALATVREYEGQAADKGLKLTIVQLEEEICSRSFNGSLLLTVMTNLVRNAVNYTKKGSVSIGLMKNGFSIRDTGPGIPKEELKAIFEPFYRGSNAVSVHGSGVGLSLANRICQEKHWRLKATSVVGKGSIFTLTFH